MIRRALSSVASALMAALMIGAALSLAHAQPVAEPAGPGGSGRFESGARPACFQASGGRVQQVCASYVIRWKLWTLMGEPVGDYVLNWKLASIILCANAGKGCQQFSPAALPPPLAAGAAKIELSITGMMGLTVASHVLDHANSLYVYHLFDTGAGVRPGAGASFNVPGSKDWSQWFFVNGSCDGGERQPMSAAQAKTMMRDGVKVAPAGLKVCPNSGVSNLEALEAAAERLCDQGGAYRFCAPRPKAEAGDDAVKSGFAKLDQNLGGGGGGGSGVADGFAKLDQTLGRGSPRAVEGMDNVFAALDRERALPGRLAQERAKFDAQSAAVCRAKLQTVNACFTQVACAPPVLPVGYSETQCHSVPCRPGSCPARIRGIVLTREEPDNCGGDPECRARKDRDDEAERERRDAERAREAEAAAAALPGLQAEWDAHWRSIQAGCQSVEASKASFKTCEARFTSHCNPAGLTQETCLQSRSQNAPTEDDVRRMMEREDLARQHTTVLPDSTDDAGPVDKLRKALRCDPKVSKCRPRKTTNPGGVRG